MPKQKKPKKPKARGNGQGTAYKRGKTWEACVTLGMVAPKDPAKKPYPKKHRKGGFLTKTAALAYCLSYVKGGKERPKKTLEQVYEEWSAKYTSRVGESTMAGYSAAYKHFKPDQRHHSQ